MAIDFQIQEMIHQDADGVIFQALDKQTGHLVALRRFFLPDEVISLLKEKEENGKTVFENGVEWLKSLDVPHLQRVVTGGFDDLDDTPYFVTEWIDGRKLTEGHEQGIFSAGEGEVFDGQARSVLLALPMEVRPAVCLEEERILVSRDDTGSLVTTFLMSPRRYFGAKGGMEFKSLERQEVLDSLKERFPAGEVAQAAPVAGQVKGQILPNTQPVLKSAKTSSGGGLLWGALGALVVILGVGGWLVVKESKERSQTVVLDEEPKAIAKPSEEVADNAAEEMPVEEGNEGDAPEMAGIAEEETAKPAEEPTSPAGEEGEQGEEVAVEVAEEMVEDPESPVAVVPPSPEPIPTPEPEVAETKEFYSPEDLEALKKMGGQKIEFRGEVSASSRSGDGKGVLLYLDFGNRYQNPFVSFRFGKNPTPVKRGDWDAFVGKEVVVKAKVIIQPPGRGKRGTGVVLSIDRMDQVRLKSEKPKERVYQFADLDDLRVISPGEKVIFEGEFKNFQKNKNSVYLFFEDGFSIVGRFEVGGPLSNPTFAKKLKEMKGKRVRLVGMGASDENAKFEVVIQLSEQSGFVEAASPETESDE